MTSTDSYAVIASRLQMAWEAGRICSLVGRGCRARVVRISRLVAAGRLDPEAGARLAHEAEEIGFAFAPLPPEDAP